MKRYGNENWGLIWFGNDLRVSDAKNAVASSTEVDQFSVFVL